MISSRVRLPLTDVAWETALKVAFSSSIPDVNLTDLRARVEFAAFLLRNSEDTKNRPNREMASYAASGEDFLRGIRQLTEMLSLLDATMHVKGYNDDIRFATDGHFLKRISRLCDLMRRTQQFADEITFEEDPNARSGPNSKPFLHMAVEIVWGVWCDLVGNNKRLKKEFHEFAYQCLKHTRLITADAIKESFDRHVVPPTPRGRPKAFRP